jgi:hypothetical protein
MRILTSSQEWVRKHPVAHGVHLLHLQLEEVKAGGPRSIRGRVILYAHIFCRKGRGFF